MTEQVTPRGELEDALVQEVCELIAKKFNINNGRDVLSLIQVSTRVYAAQLSSAYCMLGDYDADKCVAKLESDFMAHFDGLRDLLTKSIRAECEAWGKIFAEKAVAEQGC